jgi:hypothetical protein
MMRRLIIRANKRAKDKIKDSPRRLMLPRKREKAE